MIQIKNKFDCCGCSACAQKCPRHCITMQEDTEGFLYPSIDLSQCIDCGLCEKVCPILHNPPSKLPIEVFASTNKNEYIRKDSSSGGLFSLIATYIISLGGVVFGARFNNEWEVIHDYTTTERELALFRGSKYSQSKIGETFIKVESFLKDNIIVLFTGTPCQISGLKSFLRKDYDHLICVDITCHSVPSPKIWKRYLNEKIKKHHIKKREILSINFRDKYYSWTNYSFVIKTNKKKIVETKDENKYLVGFIHGLFSRPSCTNCCTKPDRNQSDITLGDFWGISQLHPEINDDKGVSIIIVRTKKGQTIIDKLHLDKTLLRYEDIVKYNPAINSNSPFSKYRNYFFNEEGSLEKKIDSFYPTPFKSIIKRFILQRLNCHHK